MRKEINEAVNIISGLVSEYYGQDTHSSPPNTSSGSESSHASFFGYFDKNGGFNYDEDEGDNSYEVEVDVHMTVSWQSASDWGPESADSDIDGIDVADVWTHKRDANNKYQAISIMKQLTPEQLNAIKDEAEQIIDDGRLDIAENKTNEDGISGPNSVGGEEPGRTTPSQLSTVEAQSLVDAALALQFGGDDAINKAESLGKKYGIYFEI